MSYITRILSVGPEAASFLEEKLALTFAGNAPEELRDYCFLIEDAELDGHLAVGQIVQIGEQSWNITALGSVAEKNLVALGHVTLVFDGESEPRMDGAVHLGGVDAAPELAVGTRLVFAT
ncbi:MAG: PTS glucitol/sorbitol transporter subunit IIA [Arachnia sp.]